MREAATPSRPPLALIVNDQEWSLRSLESILAPSGYATVRAYNGAQAMERARSEQPDLILLDVNLPDTSGIDVCRVLRGDPRIGASTPILIISSDPPTRRVRLEALRAGAWQFLSVPLDAEELLLQLEVYVKARLEGERAGRERLLDEMSGLYNARGLLRRVRELASEARRRHRGLACVIFGTELGRNTTTAGIAAAATRAAVGSELARLFKDFGRLSDTVGRLSETEFAVVAPETDPAGALKLAQRLIEAADGVRAERAGEAPRGALLRAGCYAVPDLREAALEPVDLLARATLALRYAQTDPAGRRIRFYGGDGEGAS